MKRIFTYIKFLTHICPHSVTISTPSSSRSGSSHILELQMRIRQYEHQLQSMERMVQTLRAENEELKVKLSTCYEEKTALVCQKESLKDKLKKRKNNVNIREKRGS